VNWSFDFLRTAIFLNKKTVHFGNHRLILTHLAIAGGWLVRPIALGAILAR
jgi:hypothetical protein